MGNERNSERRSLLNKATRRERNLMKAGIKLLRKCDSLT